MAFTIMPTSSSMACLVLFCLVNILHFALFYRIISHWHGDVHRRVTLPATIKDSCITAISATASASTTAAGNPRADRAWTVYAHRLPHTTQPDRVFHTLFRHDDASVWLDSARENDRQSRFSLMGSCQSTTGFKVEYRLARKQIDLYRHTGTGMQRQTDTLSATDTFWDWTSRLLGQFRDVPLAFMDGASGCCDSDEASRPVFDFATGLVGYFGYEMKEEALPGYERPAGMLAREDGPDAAFLFLDRFVSIDYATGTTWLVGLVCHDAAAGATTVPPHTSAASMPLPHVGMSMEAYRQWIEETARQLAQTCSSSSALVSSSSLASPHAEVVADTCDAYIRKIERAQSLIRDGESYELCLTTQVTGQLPRPLAHCADDTARPWTTLDFYRQLRHDNPAPYAAYLNLGSALCIASASPERFLRVSREGIVQMRPIKGTLKRQRTCCCGRGCVATGDETTGRPIDPPCARERDAALAHALSIDTKERGENLMIVDLIRNDLARICPPHTVRVPQLMTVETYETVHQMVTTVEGRLKDTVDAVKALQCCFPPGSMTGAPKLRSVQLLEQLEDHRPRGIYSGCLGYLSINGSADFNVVIRTVVMRDGQAITIGAGGAITILSDPMEEWREAITKADAVLPRR
ncbi:ADC synthase [Syncephalis pseudoplumigaleata]|uniref:ADC synthase n=1 Tax=Syncephalis pseudoplumigaleata TaxID=1712513 RepID=A0A4P9YZQ0_9FUNG|nr:ADC synthase [Syncephalis pseudoplumigaleata]|eukprot:RKP25616.1 ADC synthase [Syncephalis pseudoplumigaleata]